MRFHTITVENLNSLYGRHELDLDAGLGGAGLFLIHGPTGAGKSTLLDAICLALYGQTPRLTGKTIQNGVPLDGVSENSPELTMSRGAATALASVVFSVTTPEGERTRHRASWSVHRAHKRADGEFQKPTRRLEIWRDGAWMRLVESVKEKDYGRPFESALQGLSFDDFQRTTLLAQFAFRQFLDAKKEERGSLLERMTASGRFRELGRGAADKQREAQAAVDAVDAELAGRRLLTAEERLEREDALKAALTAATALKQQVEVTQRREAAWIQYRVRRGATAAARAGLRAVDESTERHRPELDALEQDALTAPARTALLAWKAARSTVVRMIAAHEAAKTELARSEAAYGAALTRSAETDAARAAAAGRLTEAEPTLAVATDAWQALAAATAHAATTTADLDSRQDALARAQSTLTAAERGLVEVNAQRDALVLRLDAVPARDRVVNALGRLEDQVHRLAVDEALAEARRKDAKAAAATLSRATTSLEKARADATAANDVALAQRALCAKATTELAAAAGGDDPELGQTALSERRDALSESLRELQSLSEWMTEHTRLQTEREAHAAAKAALDVELSAATAAALQHDQALEAVNAHLSTLAEHLDALGKILHLVDVRNVLKDDEPCPLCGSDEHPYRAAPDTAPDASDYREKLKSAEARQKALVADRVRLSKVRDTAHSSVARLTARLDAEARVAAEREERLGAIVGRIATTEGALSKAGVLAGPVTTEAMSAASKAAEFEAVSVNARLAALTGARRAQRAAEERLRELERSLLTANDALVRAESDHQLATAKLASTGDALAEVDDRIASQDKALRDAFADVGVGEPTPAAALARLRERAKAVTEGEAERTRLDALWQTRNTEVATAQERRGAAAAELDRALSARDEATRALARARSESARHFGGEDPTAVRDRFQAALRRAASEHETAQKGLTATGAARAAASATDEERRRALSEAERIADETRAAFHVATGTLGLPSDESAEDAVLQRSLTDARRDELLALRKRLEREAVTAASALAEAERSEADHRAALREDEGGGELRGDDGDDGIAESAILALSLVKAQLDSDRSRIEQDAGALRNELAQDDLGRDERAALESRRAALEDDRVHWTAIADLIGTRNGGAFVEIVQALNLRSVIARANDRLARFLPRYSLEQVVGEDHAPRLDFRVSDACGHGMPRPVKSLSGGESFIVSLALALGLADLRSTRLRIETLLIDEGFGSLDSDTLQHVLGALTALQQASGAQIGLISHVDAMREAIPSQIQVKPSGEGRSTAVFAPRS